MTTPEDTELREMLELNAETIETDDGEYLAVDIDRAMNLITLHTEKEVKRKMDIIKMSDSYTFITGEKYYNQRMMDRATNKARIDDLAKRLTQLKENK